MSLLLLSPCLQIPSPGVHQAHLHRGHLLPRADRAKGGDGFWRGKHQSAVEVGAGLHGEREAGFSRRGIPKNCSHCSILVTPKCFYFFRLFHFNSLQRIFPTSVQYWIYSSYCCNADKVQIIYSINIFLWTWLNRWQMENCTVNKVVHVQMVHTILETL